MRLHDFIKKTEKAENPKTLFTLLIQSAQDMGFDYVAYMTPNNSEFNARHRRENTKQYPPPFLETNFPNFWLQHYSDHHYQNSDPVLHYSSLAKEPFLWQDLYKRCELTDTQRLLLKEAEAAGLNNGFSIPLQDSKSALFIISFARKNALSAPSTHIQALTLRTVQFHKTYQKRLNIPNLTEKELECLRWIAKGKSSWEIGVILGTSETTINFHVREAMEKLNASNRSMAVMEALKFGLLKF